MKFEVFTEYRDYANELNFYIFKDNLDGSRDICTSLDKMEFTRHNADGTSENIKPTFSIKGMITQPFLQEMANALKKIGIKAEGEPIIENELSAVKYHLEDMRALTFRFKPG